MIKNTFILLAKIGTKKEQTLWSQGITDWDKFLKTKYIKGWPKKQYYDHRIIQAQQELSKGNSEYFSNKMPSKEKWRLYDHFKDEAGYLDLEIDSYGRIIVIGLSNYYNTNFLVRGVNLDKENLQKELDKYKIIVTFNGSAFDLPRIKNQLGVEVKVPHIDLKPLCINLGLKGGLKEIEKQLNLRRPEHLNGNPVELWKAFQASTDREYLELLLDYNREDCENLKGVMEYVYREMKGIVEKLYKPIRLH
ncbi:MAG TPA: ribonuclease H-like domain-containing protein [Candidatus Nanoarchaeia archaeon]|nr:ribonuclease H-like domain-containing protein [Candidatus Nanoarchaeia archaeon]